MIWAKHLRIGKKIESRVAEVVAKLDGGERVHRAYLLTLAANGVDELDLIPAAQAKEKDEKGALPKIIGIAASKKEAMQLVEEIAKDCLRARQDLKLRVFIEENENS